MTYTCAVFPTEDATLEQAQYYKYDLVAKKLDDENPDASKRMRSICFSSAVVRRAPAKNRRGFNQAFRNGNQIDESPARNCGHLVFLLDSKPLEAGFFEYML